MSNTVFVVASERGCEISVRYPRSECCIRNRHQMARMRVHRHSKCCRYASATGKIVASVSVCRPNGGNLKHSHTLKIRRPSVLTPGKYPASLSKLRILRSNYEYGTRQSYTIILRQLPA